VRVGAGHGDGRVGIAGDGVGRVVDAGDAHADGGGEGRLLRRERHVVEHDALEVALRFGVAGEVDKLLLLEDGLGGLCGGRPGRGGLLEAEVVERRADLDDHGAVERVLGVGGVEGVGLGERVLGGAVANDHGVHGVDGGGGLGGHRHAGHLQLFGRDVERLLHGGGELVAGLGADGHLFFCHKASSAECAGTSGLFLHRGCGGLRRGADCRVAVGIRHCVHASAACAVFKKP